MTSEQSLTTDLARAKLDLAAAEENLGYLRDQRDAMQAQLDAAEWVMRAVMMMACDDSPKLRETAINRVRLYAKEYESKAVVKRVGEPSSATWSCDPCDR